MDAKGIFFTAERIRMLKYDQGHADSSPHQYC